MKTVERSLTLRRNYSLDSEVVRRFEAVVPKGERSRALEEMMAHRAAETERATLHSLIRAGLEDMAEVYAETEGAWASADAEAMWPAP